MNRDISWMIGEMESMRVEYYNDTGRQPIGWVMGIDEYEKIREAIVCQLNEDQRKNAGDLNYFNGLPITVKSSRGIELSMDIDGAMLYRKMRKKLRRTQEEELI